MKIKIKNLWRKKPIYPPKRTNKEWKIVHKNPYADSDRDKVMNWFDCKPLNKNKQGTPFIRRHTPIPSQLPSSSSVSSRILEQEAREAEEAAIDFYKKEEQRMKQQIRDEKADALEREKFRRQDKKIQKQIKQMTEQEKKEAEREVERRRRRRKPTSSL